MVKQVVALTVGNRWLGLAYLVGGAIVSRSHGYFDDLGTVRGLVSSALALVLWPLLWWPGITIS